MSFVEDKWAWMDNMDDEELKCTIVRITNEHKQQVAELKKRIKECWLIDKKLSLDNVNEIIDEVF